MPVIFIPKKIYAYATIKLTRLLQATLALLLLTLVFSCKKIDTAIPISKSNYAEKFFEKPATAPAELQAIIDLLKNENDKSGFVNRLPANAGLPVWEKLINERPKPKAGCAARGIIADENGNYLIPLSSDDKTLSALLFAMNRKDTYEFYYYDNNYAYRIAFNDKYSLAKREYVMALFISMSNYVFGINEFKNIPKDLFTASGSRPDENGMANKITIVPTDGTPPKIFTNGRVVGSITNCGYQWAGQCNCRPNCRSTSCCDHPWGYCISNYCTYEKCYTIIFEEEDPPPGSGEGGGGEHPSNPGSTTGGGPNGPGSSPHLSENQPQTSPNPPCNNCAWYTEVPGQNFEQDCGPDGMILDNECVSPSDYPGKENDYPYRWWEDELWMDENLRLDLEGTSDPTGLTAAEKDFALAHKRAFCRIALCATTARKETERRYPGDWPNGRNDKADAFRHTYWMALCAWLLENNALVREYGEAHESETTEPLEKQMDLHNNDIGISTGRSLFYPTQQEIIEAVVNAMNNGQCWYLNPLVEQTHAIKNDTHLTPTNH